MPRRARKGVPRFSECSEQLNTGFAKRGRGKFRHFGFLAAVWSLPLFDRCADRADLERFARICNDAACGFATSALQSATGSRSRLWRHAYVNEAFSRYRRQDEEEA